MFQKLHKFKNTVLKKRCFEEKFMRIYLLYILVSQGQSEKINTWGTINPVALTQHKRRSALFDKALWGV